MACWLPGEDSGLSSTLLTPIGELATNEADSTAIDDAALLIDDEATAWTEPALTTPPAPPTASQPPEPADLRFPPAAIPLPKRAKYSAFGSLTLWNVGRAT
jgi:hypothetical protein